TRWPRDWSSDVCSSDLREALRVVRRGLNPRVVPPVAAKVRAATEVEAGRSRSDAAVVVLLQHARIPEANPIGFPVGRTTEAAAETGRASCREIGNQTGG